MNQSKCNHCPLLPEDRECPGQKNSAVCDRADATSPRHNPGILEQILNFGKAVVQHVAAGMPLATEATQAERRAICQACEHYEAEQEKCRVCGCGGLKLAWADQSCPLDPPKWGPVTPDDQRE